MIPSATSNPAKVTLLVGILTLVIVVLTEALIEDSFKESSRVFGTPGTD
jgi:hypothetical protein